MLAMLVAAVVGATPPAPVAQDPGGDARATQVAAVLVKDFLRLENSGAEVAGVEFLRYFPVADGEQFAVARWVVAATDDGEPIGAGVASVSEDPAGNLVHTLRLDRVPAKTGVVVTTTSIVLRRERRAPAGACPIPAPEAYPEGVRRYLASTNMVVHDRPEVRELAARLREEAGGDVVSLARGIARHMNSMKYESEADAPWGKEPTSVVVLAHGGSCCSSAAGAAAVLRACGVPAQLTYAPAGYVHGVVRFYVDGYGWMRMDATCSSARVPLFDDLASRGLVRLFDTPIEMEALDYAYAWPYYHNTLEGAYAVWSGGERVAHIRLAGKGETEAARNGTAAPLPHVAEPFPHLEPGSWNTVLRLLRWEVAEGAWGRVAAASRGALMGDAEGPLGPVLGALAAEGLDPKFEDLLRRAGKYGTGGPPDTRRGAAGPPGETRGAAGRPGLGHADQATAGSRR